MSPATHLVAASGESHALVITVLVQELREAGVAYALRDEAIGVIEREQARNVVIDLQHTKFIGSVGFLAFLAIRRQLAGGRIVLCNMSAAVQDVFAICRLIPTANNQAAPFETASSVDAAIRSLTS